MGGTTYCSEARSVRATTNNFHTAPAREIFKARSLENAMSPHGLGIRESRDSEAHPESIAIIIALDVTGSMGSIPHNLVKNGLPHIMETIIESGIKDPQVLFLGIGDHLTDQAPLQVGQFESGDAELDHWLTNVYLEGNGGGNGGESYFLAWLVAAMHTSIDCLEKRNQKGFLFTIGDEEVHPYINKHHLINLMGPGKETGYQSTEILDLAREKYNVYHLHLRQGANGTDPDVINSWKELMGKNLIMVDNKESVASAISGIVTSESKPSEIDQGEAGGIDNIEKTNDNPSPDSTEEEVIL